MTMRRTLVKIEVVRGVEGPCLVVRADYGGHRVAGPKPWGGGQIIHTFVVDAGVLIDAIRDHSYTAMEGAKP